MKRILFLLPLLLMLAACGRAEDVITAAPAPRTPVQQTQPADEPPNTKPTAAKNQAKPHEVIVSSNGESTDVYAIQYEKATYMADDGGMMCGHPVPFDPSEVRANLSAFHWNSDFSIQAPPGCSIRYFRIYDDSLTEYDEQFETLDISLFHNPGEYIVRFVSFWKLDQHPDADRPDSVSYEHFFRLVIGADDLK